MENFVPCEKLSKKKEAPNAERSKGHSANDVFRCVERDVPYGVMFACGE